MGGGRRRARACARLSPMTRVSREEKKCLFISVFFPTFFPTIFWKENNLFYVFFFPVSDNFLHLAFFRENNMIYVFFFPGESFRERKIYVFFPGFFSGKVGKIYVFFPEITFPEIPYPSCSFILFLAVFSVTPIYSAIS